MSHSIHCYCHDGSHSTCDTDHCHECGEELVPSRFEPNSPNEAPLGENEDGWDFYEVDCPENVKNAIHR
jgi:hypothetical protein